MQLQDAITQRRAVKHFEPGHVLSEVEINRLYANAILAPTSFNIQHWRFVRVTDATVRQQLREAAWDQAQVTEASELVVITGDIDSWQKQPDRYWVNAGPEKQAMFVDMLTGFYTGRVWIQRDEAIRSGAFAAQNMMLTAKAMGYDSSPMIGFDQERVADIIRLPENHVIVMMLAVGKAVREAAPRGGQLPLEAVVFENRFGG